jgi:ubiquinone/menaquinone biosynthesis C-methylase UbiE
MHPDAMDLTGRQQIEIEYWRQSPTERPDVDSVENVVNKMSEAGIFLGLLRAYEADFAGAGTILELGGGQGWASCIVKNAFPAAHVTATDISEYAIASAAKWERILQARLDATHACRSYEIPVPDASLDLVFCFAAAHHFVAHRRTFRELQRVLRPGGRVLYLYEPSCRPFLHRLAHERVNRKRPHVPEDVLVFPKLTALAEEAGFRSEYRFWPSTIYRSPAATLYYSVLARVAPLRQVLPCTANYRFEKPR